MHLKKVHLILLSAGVLTLVVTGIALAMVQPVKAQCGSQISSCKNCHEVQAKDPVNSDGTSWHQSHAFGDFCYICHAGNNQATDETAAHAGLVSPMADVKASCAQCHPNDLDARAQVYAKKLGVKVGTSAAAAPASTAAPTTAPASAAPAVASQPPAPEQASVLPANQNIVDYVQRYDENVLGEHPTNWGNVILLVILIAIVLVAGFLILRREGLVVVSFKESRPLDKELPSDVAEMAPEIARLKPAARKSLRRLLSKPRAAAELFSAIDDLSPNQAAEQTDKDSSDPDKE